MMYAENEEYIYFKMLEEKNISSKKEIRNLFDMLAQVNKENEKLKKENNNLKKDIEIFNKFDRRAIKAHFWYMEEIATLKAANNKLELLFTDKELKLSKLEKIISDLDFPPSSYSINLEKANKDKEYLQEIIKEKDSIIVNHLEKIKQLEGKIICDEICHKEANNTIRLKLETALFTIKDKDDLIAAIHKICYEGRILTR